MLAKVFIVSFLASMVFGTGEHTVPSDDCEDIVSIACHNFNVARQNGINQQIALELEASYTYMAMGAYFSRDNPNHKGFAKFFFASSAEEREHAMKLIEYQNMRGGIVTLSNIQAPENHEFTSGYDAMNKALALEKRVNFALLRLHQSAHDDPQMQDFLEANYLDEQVTSIRELAGYVNELRKLNVTNPALGEHVFDEKLLKD